MKYADGTLVRFEREGAPMGGAVFIGSDCKMEINRNNFATNPADFVKDAPDPAVQSKWEGDGWIARPHIQNWLDCIKSRELPNADVEIGHRSISDLPPGEHHPRAGPQAAVGSGDGAVRRRRRSQQTPRPPAPRRLRAARSLRLLVRSADDADVAQDDRHKSICSICHSSASICVHLRTNYS